jgi:kynurenine formamidase
MIYDVTVPITNAMPVWPGDPAVQLSAKSHLSGDKTHTVRLTAIEMGSHTGTHIDAPFHMIEDGKRLDEFPLETLIGKAAVFEIPNVRSVGREELQQLNWNGWNAFSSKPRTRNTGRMENSSRNLCISIRWSSVPGRARRAACRHRLPFD